MPERHVTNLATRLVFPACPQWFRDRLWFVDALDNSVWNMTEAGQRDSVAKVPARPVGLGWGPGGRLLVTTGHTRSICRVEPTGFLSVLHDLSGHFEHEPALLLADAHGRAYVTSLGFDPDDGGDPEPAPLVCVDFDEGDAWTVIEDLHVPNGLALSADGRTLLVAESWAQRVSAYTVREDGSVEDPRVWADVAPNVPVGVALDEEGAVWLADPVHCGVMRVFEGAGPIEWIPMPQNPYGLALGGSDGRTLYVCTAPSSEPEAAIEARSGTIEAVRVDVPGVPLPEPPPLVATAMPATPTGRVSSAERQLRAR